MTRLVIICEGITEEGFVKNCLAPDLVDHSVYAIPQLLSRRPGARGGGDVSLTSLVAHIRRVHRNFDCVTTFVDFYGFSGKGEMDRDELLEAITERTIEQIGVGFDPRRVFPYVQMHEFEALLFSNPECFDVEEKWTDGQRQQVATIRNSFPTPEEINDHPHTARNRSAPPSSFRRGSRNPGHGWQTPDRHRCPNACVAVIVRTHHRSLEEKSVG